jgi:hypothetical protein
MYRVGIDGAAFANLRAARDAIDEYEQHAKRQ